MSRCFGMQLPEAFDLRHRQIVAAHVEPRVKKHAAMPRRQNEIIPPDPARLVWIMFQRMTIEHGTHLRAAERKSEMPRLRCLHRVHAKTARFGRGPRKR